MLEIVNHIAQYSVFALPLPTRADIEQNDTPLQIFKLVGEPHHPFLLRALLDGFENFHGRLQCATCSQTRVGLERIFGRGDVMRYEKKTGAGAPDSFT
jgi:hypothetical protein